jgi:hypothetical protein
MRRTLRMARIAALYPLEYSANERRESREPMTESSIVRYVSGDWNAARGHVRLRIETDKLGQPQDLLIAPGDIQALVVLLLTLSGKAGAGRTRGLNDESRQTLPLDLDSIALGETEDGEIVLQVDVGRTALAFSLPPDMSRELGHTLMTLSAPSTREPAN